MTVSDLEICGMTVAPGERKRQDIPIAQTFDKTQLTMPMEIMRGEEKGPILLLVAAMHGDELNGCEIVKRILNYRGLHKKLKGTIVAVPIVNVFGYNRNVRYLPDRRDLNRCFPGSKDGSTGARIANVLLNDIAVHCTHAIDFHTGAIHRSNYPQVRASLDIPAVHDMAMSFNLPVILNASLREASFRKSLNKMEIPCIVYEGGEALRYEESIIKSGINGTLGVMASLGMLPKGWVKLRTLKKMPFIAKSSVWMRAPDAGSLRFNKRLGSYIKKGDVIGVISNAFGRHKTSVIAQHAGVIIGIINMPLVMPGDAIVHIAMFENPREVKKEIEFLDDEIDIYQF